MNTNVPYFGYLDFLPNVPEELLETYDDVVSRGWAEATKLRKAWADHPDWPIRIYDVKPDLKEWLTTVFQPYLGDVLQIHYLAVTNSDKSNKHRDVVRTTSFNYVVDTGGTAITRMFDDEGNILDTCQIEQKRWCQLSFVDKYHDVHFVDYQRPRYSIIVNAPKTSGHFNLLR